MTHATDQDSRVPWIPREQWSSHPNYPEHLLLLGSHESFRRTSRALIEAAERGDSSVGVGSLYLRWIMAMRSHEAYEEHKLYPFLEHRFGARLSDLRRGHEQLHARDREVRRALLASGGAEDASDLVAALRAHDEVLRNHLEQEEDRVIPMLLELPPREFREYTRRPIELLVDDGGSGG